MQVIHLSEHGVCVVFLEQLAAVRAEYQLPAAAEHINAVVAVVCIAVEILRVLLRGLRCAVICDARLPVAVAQHDGLGQPHEQMYARAAARIGHVADLRRAAHNAVGTVFGVVGTVGGVVPSKAVDGDYVHLTVAHKRGALLLFE